MSTEVHQAAETVTTSNELDVLFGPLFDEYFNGENQVVLKSSAVTTTDASNKRQQQLFNFIHFNSSYNCHADWNFDFGGYLKITRSENGFNGSESYTQQPINFHYDSEVIGGYVRSYALSWKPCQGDSLNLPDHRLKPQVKPSPTRLESPSSKIARNRQIKKEVWNRYLRKGRKTKPKRQNRTRNGKAWKRQSQDKAQV
ncbi:hypothetical protein Tco_1500257 [Tanacetum coccineum]